MNRDFDASPAPIVAIIPLKRESKRLPGKNFLDLGGRPLAAHVIETAVASGLFERVMVFCSDSSILEELPPGVDWLPRDRYLDGDEIQANELFMAAVSQVDHEIVFLLQVTSPFLKVDTLRKGVAMLTTGRCDSVVAVERKQKYAWLEGQHEPLNYSPGQIARTQEISSVFLETSGFYGFKRADYLRSGSRINGTVGFVELAFDEAIDIDYPDDFLLAQSVLRMSEELKDDRNLGAKNEPISGRSSPPYDKPPVIRMAVLDMDGVLIDSLDGMAKAWEAAMAMHKLNVPFVRYREHIGRPFFDILRKLKIPESLHEKVSKSYFAHPAHQDYFVYEGVLDALEIMESAGLSIAILTSKPRERVEKILSRSFSFNFSAVVTPEEIRSGRGKPSPDGLLQIFSEHGIDPAEAVFIGDMVVDFEAADRAGAHFFWATWGYGTEPPPGIPKFSNLHQCATWLSRLSPTAQ